MINLMYYFLFVNAKNVSIKTLLLMQHPFHLWRQKRCLCRSNEPEFDRVVSFCSNKGMDLAKNALVKWCIELPVLYM